MGMNVFYQNTVYKRMEFSNNKNKYTAKKDFITAIFHENCYFLIIGRLHFTQPCITAECITCILYVHENSALVTLVEF